MCGVRSERSEGAPHAEHHPEVDFQATDEQGLQSWLDDLQYVCSDPLAALPPTR